MHASTTAFDCVLNSPPRQCQNKLVNKSILRVRRLLLPGVWVRHAPTTWGAIANRPHPPRLGNVCREVCVCCVCECASARVVISSTTYSGRQSTAAITRLADSYWLTASEPRKKNPPSSSHLVGRNDAEDDRAFLLQEGLDQVVHLAREKKKSYTHMYFFQHLDICAHTCFELQGEARHL